MNKATTLVTSTTASASTESSAIAEVSIRFFIPQILIQSLNPNN